MDLFGHCYQLMHACMWEGAETRCMGTNIVIIRVNYVNHMIKLKLRTGYRRMGNAQMVVEVER